MAMPMAMAWDMAMAIAMPMVRAVVALRLWLSPTSLYIVQRDSFSMAKKGSLHTLYMEEKLLPYKDQTRARIVGRQEYGYGYDYRDGYG